MSRVGAVLGVLLLATSASALLYFEATITVSYDPDMRGSLTGSMWYQYDASDTTQNYKKISYVLSSTSGSSSTYTQIYNYTSGTSYLKCPSECTASMITSSIEVLTMQSGESKSSSSSTCAAYTRSSSTSDTVVTTIAFDNQGLPCYIIYGTGRRIDFTITKSSSTAASSSTWSYSSWGCPARTCNSVMDLVIIVDVSGSINDVAWASLKAFLAKLATAFDISTTATNVGVVAFSTDSELVLDLSSDSDEVQDAILYDIPRMQKRTCIGCGIYTTIDSYDRVTQSRKNLNPKNVTIMITDGGNNQCPGSTKTSVTHAYMKAAISQLKAAPYNDLSIIVAVKGDDYNPTYLLELASNASYEIPVSSYETLMTVIDKVITVTCQDYPSSPCGSNCYGFCACSGTCLCPNLCSTGGNQCINSTCSSISGVTACWNSSISCNDGKACTIDTCDTSSGCVHTMQACACVPADCDDNNWCTVDACNVTTAGSNCTHSNTTCDDGNPCTVDSCDATNKKCTHTNYCDDGLYCTDDVCTASTDLKSATCTHSSITCTMNSTLNTTDKTYRCYKALCNETAKCHWEFVASTAKCSGCRKGVNSTSETCIGALTVAEAAAVLSVAAVAGIIVAAVIGFMIFSAVSAAGTYKLIKMMKDNNTMAATNNPMYKPSDSESVNPAYAQR